VRNRHKIKSSKLTATITKHSIKPEPVELDISELKSLIDNTGTRTLSEAERDKLCIALDTLGIVGDELDKKRVSIQRLKQMLFGDTTEKTANVVKAEKPKEDKLKEPVKGHGRNGSDSYTAAKKTVVKHPELKAGDICPACKKGTVYKHKPARIVRISGYSPLQAEVYEIEKLRCNLCGKIYTAPAPEGVGPEKYDAQAVAMVALLKYGSGLPFNRLAGLQQNLGIPLPASTQWEIVQDTAVELDGVFRELIDQAAQGKVLHNDDTTMKILNLEPDESGRTGIFTSGIVSILEKVKVALFFTGRKHAGENLLDLLRLRNQRLDAAIQMSDALSRNIPGGLKTIMANCLAHGRRKFVEVAESFPDECLFVLKLLGQVYHFDEQSKGMADEDRLAYHKENSGPKMAELHCWLKEQIDTRKVEPNSSLGDAICYMLKHWEKLTLFLHKAGTPLDNNICERALKKAILNRKNAYFYKTQNGARVGDLFMSLIHTCELNKVNPFDYLTQLQKNKAQITASPAQWLPWNYRENLQTELAD
jgi:transposase